jgi:hypothetical protein
MSRLPFELRVNAGGEQVPFRLWQDGVLQLLAKSPSEPDDRLNLLEQSEGTSWQWLPFVPAHGSFQEFANRGPLLVWIADDKRHTSNVEARNAGVSHLPATKLSRLQVVLGMILMLSLAANLGAAWYINKQPAISRDPREATLAGKPVESPVPPALASTREEFARALFQILKKDGTFEEWTETELLERYRQLLARDGRLRINDTEGKELVAASSLLSRRSARHIEALVRNVLSNRGYDPELINLLCRRIRERLEADAR